MLPRLYVFITLAIVPWAQVRGQPPAAPAPTTTSTTSSTSATTTSATTATTSDSTATSSAAPTTTSTTSSTSATTTSATTATTSDSTATSSAAATTTTTRPPSTACPSTAFPKQFRDVALAMHNNIRSLVATARARNGFYPNENFPPASLMYLMVYDCFAEAYAHSVARHCFGGPSPANLRPGWKENFHVLRTTATDIYGALQNAIATWQSEVFRFGAPSNVIYSQLVHSSPQRRRFTKMIWGASKEVGCATHVCSGFYNTVCLYRNFVNTIGASVYPIGAICATCPAGPNNCNPAVGLCSW